MYFSEIPFNLLCANPLTAALSGVLGSYNYFNNSDFDDSETDDSISCVLVSEIFRANVHNNSYQNPLFPCADGSFFQLFHSLSLLTNKLNAGICSIQNEFLKNSTLIITSPLLFTLAASSIILNTVGTMLQLCINAANVLSLAAGFIIGSIPSYLMSLFPDSQENNEEAKIKNFQIGDNR